eukprot:6491951-Amphidinium_carterae.3
MSTSPTSTGSTTSCSRPASAEQQACHPERLQRPWSNPRDADSLQLDLLLCHHAHIHIHLDHGQVRMPHRSPITYSTTPLAHHCYGSPR